MRGISEEDAWSLYNGTYAKDGFIPKSMIIGRIKELNPWLPIDENTPKDRPLLIKGSEGVDVGQWEKPWDQDGIWVDNHGYIIDNATHYQELP